MLRVLIVGQGLAGSWLAWMLHQRGHEVLIMADPVRQGSSYIAAGLINPITGLRWAKTWRADVLLSFCEQSYQAVEAALAIQCFAAKTSLRFFRTDQEHRQVQKRIQDPQCRDYLGSCWAPGKSGLNIHDPWGGHSIQKAAAVRVPVFLDAIEAFFKDQGKFAAERLDYGLLRILAHGVYYGGAFFDKIIFCEGAQALQNPWFCGSCLKPSQGEILTVQAVACGVPSDCILLRKHWVIPWAENTYRVGATYCWDLSAGKTDPAKRQLLASFKGFFPNTETSIINHDAAIRPNTVDTRPLLGFHPQWSALGFINGLGSKGSLWGPYLAHHFCEVMEGMAKLDPEIDMRRFLG